MILDGERLITEFIESKGYKIVLKLYRDLFAVQKPYEWPWGVRKRNKN
jgi:hypothetical protein